MRAKTHELFDAMGMFLTSMLNLGISVTQSIVLAVTRIANTLGIGDLLCGTTVRLVFTINGPFADEWPAPPSTSCSPPSRP